MDMQDGLVGGLRISRFVKGAEKKRGILIVTDSIINIWTKNNIKIADG
ncbi:hypothetical protein DJ93_2 [Bacillus clarus]|uniref:Uncharacterized protein n=1 Tax=Bacillus clarus TaxID=2338372 RepID=A0A090Z2S2_9BACI|nr:hypothetical protein DJ93_2 [Bacillus clarus]